MSSMSELPEAPASVTYSIITPNGFPALFTLRETTGLSLLTKMETLEKKFIESQYKPQERGFRRDQKPLEYVENVTCPKCNGRLLKKNKKDGGLFYQCENRKWNPTTKQAFGCDFIDWNAGKPVQPIQQTNEEQIPTPDEF